MKEKDKKRDYTHFTTRELINDPYFQDWILDPSGDSDAFWREWVLDHPEKSKFVRIARKVLKSIRFELHWPSEEQAHSSFEEAQWIIGQKNQPGDLKKAPAWMKTGWKIAAVLAGALLVGLGYYLYRQQDGEQRYSTGFGSMQVIYLPDSSRIVLNSHSTLRYRKNWAGKTKREVWLDGEAYFEVRHAPAEGNQARESDSFLVHTGNLLVQDLGTAFDIRKRRGDIEVVLIRGKIQVFFPYALYQEVLRVPGEMIRFDSLGNKLIRDSAIPENYSSWKDKKLLLTNAHLSEIIKYLEDNFGKKVILQDSLLGERTVGGELELDSLQDALFILSKTLDLDIRETDSTLMFKSRKDN
jgi:transmembrane sensor